MEQTLNTNPADGWISVADQLPVIGKNNIVTVICQMEGGLVFAAEYGCDLFSRNPAHRLPHWRWREKPTSWDILFWQPLPAACTRGVVTGL